MLRPAVVRARKANRPRRAVTILIVGVVVMAAALVAQADGAVSARNHPTANIVVGYADPLASEEGLRGVGWGEKQAIKALKLPWSVKETDAKLSSDQQVSN